MLDPNVASSGNDLAVLVENLRGSFTSGRPRPLSWRKEQLGGIDALVRNHERDIVDALRADVGKPALESLGAELTFIRSEAKFAIRHLPTWTKPRKVNTPVLLQPGKSFVVQEPLGVVLVIGPWNYPFQLVMSPLIGAVAAGNCAVLKPSELAPATSSLVARLVPKYLDPTCIRVVQGGVPETTALLEQRFDHIFYTGNGTVGRIVMSAAAKHLTPVTLELGGKSPCIIDSSADLDVAARRVTWGKFFNAGQTCVAPDYVLVHASVHDAFVARVKATIRDFYGPNPKASPDYARIVNQRHHQRLTALLGSGDVVVGGDTDEDDLFISPTVLINVSPGAPVMAEEIFGPILPVLSVGSIDDAIRFVGAREKPLALYVFASDEAVQRRVLDRTSSGGAAVNHVWLHLAVPGLPFGGVGESGMGAYHGRWSFDTFSHRKAVLVKSTKVDPPLFYPPYTESKARWIRRLL